MKQSEALRSRRNFLEIALALSAAPGALPWAAVRRAAGTFDEAGAQNTDDAAAFDFWSSFLQKEAEPIVSGTSQARGGSSGGNSEQPVFLHYGPEGFKNAAELDTGKLISEGDVMVSVNTSTVKLASQDLATFQQLQNAQIRVDVAQKKGILPIIEAMAYTVVGAMHSANVGAKGKSSKTGSSVPKKPQAVQSISVNSDADWQKMQNIPLPGGEGKWALNLEAQKKDSLFCQVLQTVIKEAGQFAPVIGLPGICVSALQSFNILYGALHSRPVSIIQAPPLRVFATQEALQKTGAPGAVTGILLQSGTYVLIPAKQLPSADELGKLTVMQGRVVPPKTSPNELDEAAANTLANATYVTFDVQVEPTNLFTTAPPKKTT